MLYQMNNLLNWICIIFLLFAGYNCFWHIQGFNDFLMSVLFFSIAFLSVLGIALSKKKKTMLLNTTFCLFYYFFFSIAPIVQYKNATVFQYTKEIGDTLYARTGVLLLIVLLVYLILYRRGVRFAHKTLQPPKSLSVLLSLKDIPLTLYYLMAVSAVCIYFYLIHFNWSLLVFRTYIMDLKSYTKFGLLGYAILNIVKLIPFALLLLYQFQIRKVSKHSWVLLFFLLLTCFPTALSRTTIAIIYIPILLLFVPRLEKGVNYLAVFVFGFLVVFPLSNSFRLWNEGLFSVSYELFNSGDFDAFQNFTLLMDSSLITGGRQLLGALLFFVPESIWIDRPIGTGAFLAEHLGFGHTNIAMPYFGEAYANFGYLGVFIFLMVLIAFNVLMDTLFLKKGLTLFGKYIFYVFLSIEFILLRGDLWNAVKISSSFLLACISVLLVSKGMSIGNRLIKQR